MTRLILILLFLGLLLASPAAAGRNSRKVAERADRSSDCLRLASRDDVVRSGPVPDRRLGAVHLSGASLPDDALWELVGGRPSLPFSREGATALVARFAQTGLFSAVEPKVLGEEMPELEIALTENPTIQSVRVRGLSEFRTEDVLDQLFEVPSVREIERRRREVLDARPHECPAPLPPREWLARLEDG